MSVAVVLAVILAAGVGISLGLLGGGGSILAVPLLVYVAGLPAKQAIATSLLVVGATAAVGLVPHARAGRVRWRTGLIFGFAGMAGAYAGGRVSGHIPDGVLLIGFAVMMLATAVAMIRSRRSEPPAGRQPSLPRTVVVGAAIGVIAGLIGAGGGFLIVPALTLLGGLAMPEAIGTSLLAIAMQSAAGLAGHLSTVHIPWPLASAVTAAAIAGSLASGRFAGRIPAPVLRRAFGWFVVAMGLLVLAQQLPARLWTSPLPWVVIGGSAAAMAGAVLARRRKPPHLGGRQVGGSHAR